MEHDQKACPRCGELTGNFYFCPSCRAQLDSSAGAPADHEASAHAAREVLRVDQALSAGANAADDGIAGDAGTAVQVEAEPQPVVRGDATAGTLDIGKVSHREVARLEDVLRPNARAEVASRNAPAIHSVPPPPSPVSQPAPGLDDEALERAKRELSRLEQLLRVSPGPDEDPTPASIPPPEVQGETAPGVQPAPRSYVAAHRLRSAFLFEQTAAFEQALALQAEEEAEEIAAPVSVPPPIEAPPAVEAASDADLAASPSADASQLWLGAACLLALIALIVALTGRRSQRCRCA